jgi:hypothetical protein
MGTALSPRARALWERTGFGTERDREEPVTRESEDIRDLIERWAAAVRAKDIAGIVADHSPEVRFFDVPTAQAG